MKSLWIHVIGFFFISPAKNQLKSQSVLKFVSPSPWAKPQLWKSCSENNLKTYQHLKHQCLMQVGDSFWVHPGMWSYTATEEQTCPCLRHSGQKTVNGSITQAMWRCTGDVTLMVSPEILRPFRVFTLIYICYNLVCVSLCAPMCMNAHANIDTCCDVDA